MRNLKKILAMALTVLMVVGSFAMTATASFDDVTDYQEAIEVMAALGIAAGKSESEFAPDDDVTREEMALWIAKIMTGKVAADYVTNNFLGAVENLTAFADLDEDNYVGAINYASNNGIIVGTSATTFEPAEAIKLQDVFAMVVRMLGYGSTAMNNNYPWSFIDKAISLGLDADLPADYSNEAVASRGETMQVLYNALTALKSDGSTLGYDFFGLEKATVVITGTSEGNLYTGATAVTKTLDGVDYVAFSVLNANGTVASNAATYYAPKTAFGIDEAALAEFYVGDSFVVRTNDGFASFLTIEACESVTVDQDAITGDMTGKDPANTYVDVDGTSYKLVDAYSDFIANNDTEIIFNAVGKRVDNYDVASYVMDKDLNILAEDDSILLYWVTTQGFGNTPAYANLNGMYLYKLSDGQYIQPNDYIWSLAKKASANTTTATGFAAILNSNTGIEKKDAYSNTVLYDDDADGNYDRALYFQYKFAKVVDNSSKKYASTDANGQKTADVAIYDADGNALTYADIDDKYVLYWYNPLYKTMIVKEIFAGQTGLVTGVDLVNKTITLNAFGANIITGVVAGETYTIGNDKLSGAEFDTVRALDTANKALTNILGKNINFIEKDGKILAIYNAVDSANYMVYVNKAPGYTTMGYQNILAYYDPAANRAAATQAVVTVNAVDNYWYSQFTNTNVATGVDKIFATGDLLKATKDALGNYDVTQVHDINETRELGLSIDDSDYVLANRVEIKNGLLAVQGADIAPFAVKADTVFVIWNGGYDFATYTGIPAGNATLAAADDVYDDAGVITKNNSNRIQVFVSGDDLVYIKKYDARDDDIRPRWSNNSNPWDNFEQNSTIIYADVNTIASMKATNAYPYGTGVVVGMTYSYTNAIDVINGGYVPNVMTDYNFNAQLQAGKFYEVKNGYVVGEFTGMSTGILLNADKQGTVDIKVDNTYDYATATAVDNKVQALDVYGYQLIRNVTADDLTKAYTDGKFEYSYKYATGKLLTNNGVLPTLYTLNGTSGLVSDVYYNATLVDALNKDHRANSTYGATATALYNVVNNSYEFKTTVDTKNKTTTITKSEFADDQGVLVYYYERGAYRNNLDSAPIFIAVDSTPITVAPNYSTTAQTVKYKVQFAAFNLLETSYNANKVVFYNTDKGLVTTPIALTSKVAGELIYTSDVQTVALGSKAVTVANGISTPGSETNAPKTFAVAVHDSILDADMVPVITYCKKAVDDPTGIFDQSEVIKPSKIDKDVTDEYTLFFFEIGNTMKLTGSTAADAVQVYINVIFEKAAD